MKLLVATTNPSKFEEASRELRHDGLEILNLKDFPGIRIVEETGKTFEENALLKAHGYFAQTDVPCVADDGGLEIAYMGGAPGVSSHRWLGRAATDTELAAAILEKLGGVPREKRGARLGGVIVFFDGSHILKRENWIEGYIAEKLMGEVKNGFPYRPLLVIPEFQKAYSELTDEEHEKVNFRRKNFREMKPQIFRFLGVQ